MEEENQLFPKNLGWYQKKLSSRVVAEKWFLERTPQIIFRGNLP